MWKSIDTFQFLPYKLLSYKLIEVFKNIVIIAHKILDD